MGKINKLLPGTACSEKTKKADNSQCTRLCTNRLKGLRGVSSGVWPLSADNCSRCWYCQELWLRTAGSCFCLRREFSFRFSGRSFVSPPEVSQNLKSAFLGPIQTRVANLIYRSTACQQHTCAFRFLGTVCLLLWCEHSGLSLLIAALLFITRISASVFRSSLTLAREEEMCCSVQEMKFLLKTSATVFTRICKPAPKDREA